MRAWPLIAAGLPWWAAVPAGYAAMLATAWLAAPPVTRPAARVG